MNNNTTNELYDDMLKLFQSYKSNENINASVKYKKILPYRKQFESIINSIASLSNTSNNSIRFFTVKVISETLVKLFVAYSIFYILAKNDSRKKIGFDFEFNQGVIALWQIAFYAKNEQIKTCFIFVVDPHIFEKECLKYKPLVIETVFTSSTKKIVHGADSLDLPYIFNELFSKNPTLIQKFIKNMSDTRFLCEYVKIINNDGNKKCSIYDALLYFNVISQSEYNDLNKIIISMGPVQDVNWNLYNMSSYHLKYTMYDVLFLEKFIKNIYLFKINKKELNLVSEINKFCCYEKYEISGILQESKQIVDTINNYFIITHGSQLKLIEIYDLIIKTLLNNQKLVHFLKTLEINNFKRFITTVLKRIVYVLTTELYQVYENKKTVYISKLSYINVFDKLLKFELVELAVKIIEFTNEAKKIIEEIIT